MTNHALKFGTARCALLDAMSNGAWFTYRDLAVIAGQRFGARILEAKREGAIFESEPWRDGKRYRLIGWASARPIKSRRRLLLADDDIASIANGCPSVAARREAEKVMKR